MKRDLIFVRRSGAIEVGFSKCQGGLGGFDSVGRFTGPFITPDTCLRGFVSTDFTRSNLSGFLYRQTLLPNLTSRNKKLYMFWWWNYYTEENRFDNVAFVWHISIEVDKFQGKNGAIISKVILTGVIRVFLLTRSEHASCAVSTCPVFSAVRLKNLVKYSLSTDDLCPYIPSCQL